MSEASTLLLALAAGVLLGIIFFGGLWWTIRRGVASRHPAVWFLGSLLLRTSLVLGGLFFVAQGDWRRLPACLLGFLLARLLVTRLSRPPIEKNLRTIAGGGT